jgi:hypothetical protein
LLPSTHDHVKRYPQGDQSETTFELDVRFSGGREEHQDFQIIVSSGAFERQPI